MSFILESLKQAEKGRQDAPDPATIIGRSINPARRPARKRRLLVWLGVLIAANALLLLVLYLRPAPTGPQPSASTPADQSPVQTPPPSAEQQTQPDLQPPPLMASPARPLALEAKPPPPLIAPDGRLPQATETPQETAQTTDKPASQATVPHGVEDTNPISQPLPTVLSLEDLPVTAREALEGLEINILGWFRDPDQRVVYINMKRYRVGDRIGPDGPLLQAITPEGIIVRHEVGLVKLRVNR